MKTGLKKLALNKETIRALQDSDLRLVGGGAVEITNGCTKNTCINCPDTIHITGPYDIPSRVYVCPRILEEEYI